MPTFKQQAIEAVKAMQIPCKNGGKFTLENQHNQTIRYVVGMLEAMEEGETLESVIEDIGKDMCRIGLIYPNSGAWYITLNDYEITL